MHAAKTIQLQRHGNNLWTPEWNFKMHMLFIHLIKLLIIDSSFLGSDIKNCISMFLLAINMLRCSLINELQIHRKKKKLYSFERACGSLYKGNIFLKKKKNHQMAAANFWEFKATQGMTCLSTLPASCWLSSHSFCLKIRLIGQMTFHTFHFEMRTAVRSGHCCFWHIILLICGQWCFITSKQIRRNKNHLL